MNGPAATSTSGPGTTGGPGAAIRTVVGTVAAGAIAIGLLGVVTGAAFGRALMGLAVGLAVGLVATMAAVMWAVMRVSPTLLKATAARPAEPGDHARLVNLVEGLAVTVGLDPPSTWVMPDSALNAFCVGLGTRHPGRLRATQSHLVVTAGLLEQLNRVELEGVIGRQLGLIRSGATAGATLQTALRFGRTAALRFRGTVARRKAEGEAGRAAAWAAEVDADLGGVAITRYPPGLAAALEKMAADFGPVRAPAWSAPLWVAPVSVPPSPGLAPRRSTASRDGEIPSVTPPPTPSSIQERIQILKEL